MSDDVDLSLEQVVAKAWDDYREYLDGLPEASASLPAPAYLWRRLHFYGVRYPCPT